MFSSVSYQALAAQMARLVRSPSARLAERHAPLKRDSTDGCGCCPRCGEFVLVDFVEPDGTGRCPRCGQPIEDLDPLGSS